MRTLLASPLLLISATAFSATNDCANALSSVETTSRSAQEQLLIARAQNKTPDVSEALATLAEHTRAAQAACAGEAAGVVPKSGETTDSDDTTPQLGAGQEEDAPRGLKRLQRSKKGY